ncbi:MAG TPA: hypothetical protein VK615_02020, partial [Candidatus Binatia bacterium]|nr:hypothetical protein [Candidatus Binatia bacterium]
NRTVSELSGIPSQRHKNTLGDVLGKVRIANHAQHGGINEINVPSHQLGKRGLRPAVSVIAQKALVGQILHL